MSPSRALRQILEDTKLWLLVMLLLSAYRVALLMAFRHLAATGTRWTEAVAPLLQGMRFDARVATVCVLPSLILGVACAVYDCEAAAQRVRLVLGGLVLSTLALACGAGFVYFGEFREPVGAAALELLYDDAHAVLLTVWKGYRPLRALGAVAAVAAGSTALLRVVLRVPWFAPGRFAALDRAPGRGILVLAGVLGIVLGVGRGSFGARAVADRDAAVSRDELLNAAVMNPPIALYFAIKKARRMAGDDVLGAYVPDGDLRAVLKRVTGRQEDLDSLDAYLAHRSTGAVPDPARHVVLVVMESYEQWPMLPAWASLGIAEGLKGIAARGVWLDRFLPASDGTMESLAVILTGLPEAGLHTAHQPRSARPYSTSLAPAFSRLGFRTRLFYGGYLSWQRVGEFARAQGFDEVYGAAHMAGQERANEWGVPDEALFAFVLAQLDDRRPSFDVVLTTSFHPPFDIDVKAEGFPLESPPADVLRRCADAPSLRMLGHFWYADRALGRFVERAAHVLPRAVFAITGDHAGRRTISANPSLDERTLVPLVLYGPHVLAGVRVPADAAGSHLDIGATLLELAAPPGFVYHAVGRNLLSPGAGRWGVGPSRVVGTTFVADVGRKASQAAPGSAEGTVLADLARLRRTCNDQRAVAWWAIKRGPAL